MSRRSLRAWFATAATAAVMLSGCTDGPAPTPPADGQPTTTAPADLNAHESGPASPIAYGVRVPDGAVQLGPLVRMRSQELLDEYAPDLEAILAERNAEESTAAPPTEPEPTPTETVPTPPVPSHDSMRLLDDPPRPDITASLMHVAGDPTEVVQRMLAELAAMLPEAGIVTNDLSQYCVATEQRITGCDLEVTGVTPGGRDVAVHLTVDPGDIVTRTGNAGTREDPVMLLTIAYIGDPREGQANRDVEELESPETPEPDISGLIWPKMDISEADEESLIGPWLADNDGVLLLSGDRPVQFAAAATDRAGQSVEIAQSFLDEFAPDAQVTRDDIVQLNETTVVRRANRPDGSTVLTATYVSARGNYIYAFVLPADYELR